MYTIDFETEAIISGAYKSPKPVGLAVKHNDLPGEYHGWGHVIENSSSFDKVYRILSDIWSSDSPILCHNAKFDLRICFEWFGLPYPKHVEDTMILAFIINPRFESLSLKRLAELVLNVPPDEQDEMRDWLVTNIKGVNNKNYGAHISKAPGNIVGKYAIGDVDRTYALYQHFMKILKQRNELCQD